MTDRLRLSDEEWRTRLTPEEYRVLRQHGTEAPGGGCFLGTHEPGTYVCAGCGNALFPSGEKFESGTGWPSFTRPVSGDAVSEHRDRSFGMPRTEVRCARCEGHLGHVFPDGPPPTGLRLRRPSPGGPRGRGLRGPPRAPRTDGAAGRRQ